MVEKPVEERADAGGVREDGVPVLEGEIGRQQDGAFLVAARDDLE